MALEGTGHHLLKSNNHDTICASMGDNVACQMQTSGTSTAVVVDIVNWDLGHAELVEDSLTAGGVAVAVAGDALINIVVADVRIEESFDTSFKSELGVIDFASWLDKLGHANAEDCGRSQQYFLEIDPGKY
jgi:hypothetical protein